MSCPECGKLLSFPYSGHVFLFLLLFSFCQTSFFVDNSLKLNGYNQRLFLLPFSGYFFHRFSIHPLADVPGMVSGNHAPVWPQFVVGFDTVMNLLIGVLKANGGAAGLNSPLIIHSSVLQGHSHKGRHVQISC